MKEFRVNEMVYTGDYTEAETLPIIPFRDDLYPQFERVYNECFRGMREALDIRPYDFYSHIRQLDGRKNDLYLLTEGDIIIGGVACCGTEIDDLFVNPAYQGRGYGRKLLTWAIARIREKTGEPITLHVAEWNERAAELYKRTGFVVRRTEVIRRT